MSRFIRLHLLAILCCLVLPAAADTVAGEVRAMTGAHTRIVWTSENAPKGGGRLIMGLDTDDDKGARALTDLGAWHRPLITPCGDRVVMNSGGTWIPEGGTWTGATKGSAPSVYVVDWGGNNLRKLLDDAIALDTWIDPADGSEWVFVQTGHALRKNGNPVVSDISGTVLPIYRIKIDEPETRVLVWNRCPLEPMTFQVSADGTRAVGVFNRREPSLVELPNGRILVKSAGCWPGMAPDNSYRWFHYIADHQHVNVYAPGGGSKFLPVCVNDADGLREHEALYSRWSNDIRFIVTTAPLRLHQANREPAPQIYLSQWNADFTGMSKYVAVTANKELNTFPDCWVAVGPMICPAAPSITLRAEQCAQPASPLALYNGTHQGVLPPISAESNQPWLKVSVNGAENAQTVLHQVDMRALTAASAQEATVTLRGAGVADACYTVAVRVSGTLSRLVVEPGYTMLPTKGTLQFTARPVDQYGKPFNVPRKEWQPQWSVSGGGSISPVGLFTSNGHAGIFTVTARVRGTRSLIGSAQISVPQSASLPPGTLKRLLVLCADTPGKTRAFIPQPTRDMRFWQIPQDLAYKQVEGLPHADESFDEQRDSWVILNAAGEHYDYLGGETACIPHEGESLVINGKRYHWTLAESETGVWSTAGAADSSVAYYGATLVSHTAQQVRIKCRIGDVVKVWVNGELALYRSWDGGADTFTSDPVPLRYGINHLLVKYVENGGDSRMEISLVDAAGRPPKNIRYLEGNESLVPAPRLADWPLVTQGLVYLWENARAANEIPGSDAPRVCQAYPQRQAKLARYYAMDTTGGAFAADNTDQRLLAACQRTNQLTLEALITPHTTGSRWFTGIMAFAGVNDDCNFMLGQIGQRLSLRLKVDGSKRWEIIPLGPIPINTPSHVVVTYTPGSLSYYLNGKLVAMRTVSGDFRAWKPYHLVFGNTWPGGRNWSGQMEGIAIYNRMLAAADVLQCYTAYRKRLAARTPAPRVKVQATLLEKSTTPTPQAILPYKRCLVVYTYQVEKVLAGKYTEQKILVATWRILDSTLLPDTKAIGKSYRLLVEPFDDNQQFFGDNMVNESMEFDLPLYYDTGR